MTNKLPIELKITFLANIVLTIVGFILGNNIIISTGIIIFVILSCTVNIIEATQQLGKEK